MPRDWYYFGCHREAGHYLFLQGMRPQWRHGWPRELSRFDGMLPPQTDTAPYIATVSRLEGWGMTALAFWDYSVDERGGCNSVVFAPSLTITPEDLLAEAQARFPEVFGRLPQPVMLAGTAGVMLVPTSDADLRSGIAAYLCGGGIDLKLAEDMALDLMRYVRTGAWCGAPGVAASEQPAWLRCEFCHQLGCRNPLAPDGVTPSQAPSDETPQLLDKLSDDLWSALSFIDSTVCREEVGKIAMRLDEDRRRIAGVGGNDAGK